MSKDLSWKLGEEIVNETITSGLSLLIVFLGVDYFALKYTWFKVINFFIRSDSLREELGLMGSSISNTFPFNYVLNTNGYNYIILGVIITGIGLILKSLTTSTKGKYIESMGSNFKVPGIIALTAVFIIQIITSYHLQIDTTKVVTGLQVWYAFSPIFLIGFMSLLTGSAMKYLISSPKLKRINKNYLYFVTIYKTLIIFGTSSLLYYVFIRFLILFKFPLIHNFLNLFILSKIMPVNVLLFCFFFIACGSELQKLGKKIHKQEILNLKQKRKSKLSEYHKTKIEMKNL